MELGGLAKEINMFILKEAIATASIQCSSEHKKIHLRGSFMAMDSWNTVQKKSHFLTTQKQVK
jgi:hypothetical protein